MALREYLTLYRDRYPLLDGKAQPSKEFLRFLKEREIDLSNINWKKMTLQPKKGGQKNAIQSKGNGALS